MQAYSVIIRLAFLMLAGWYTSARWPEATRQAALMASLVCALCFAPVVASGLLRDYGALPEMHKWSAHVLVILLWLAIPFASGAALERHLKSRPLPTIAQVLALLLLLGAALLASFTGYVGPTHVQHIRQETLNRFLVLHCVALPILMGILLAAWFWSFFRASPRHSHAEGATLTKPPT